MMNNSRKFDASSSTDIFQENHEEPKSPPAALPDNHHLASPTPFNFPSVMETPTVPVPVTHGGVQYGVNSNGSLQTNDVPVDDMGKSFRMKPVILEIPPGFDIIDCVMQFAQQYRLSVTVLTGQGLISEVDVVYPPDAIPPPCVSACYQMLSFSGIYSCLNAASGDIVSCFTVSFVDAGGNIMGGQIVSTMKAASKVTLVLAISNDL